MKRLGALRGGLLVLVLLAPLSGLGGGVAAYAGDDPLPKVGRKHLPTLGRVADLYPALEGGSRRVVRKVHHIGASSYTDCVRYIGLDGPGVVSPDRGSTASYSPAVWEENYDVDRPTAGGYRFASVAAAEATMDAFEEYTARCAGLHTGEEDHTADLTRLPDPALGDEAIAYRFDYTWPHTGASDALPYDGYQSLRVLVRDGASISIVGARRIEGDPDLDTLLVLSRIAWRRLR